MTIDGIEVTPGKPIYFKRETPNGHVWKPADVVEVHTSLPVLKVIYWTGGTKTRRAHHAWVKQSDCAWSEPKPEQKQTPK